MTGEPLVSVTGLFKFGQLGLYIAAGILTAFFVISFMGRTWPQSKKFLRPLIAPAADTGEALQARVLQKH